MSVMSIVLDELEQILSSRSFSNKSRLTNDEYADINNSRYLSKSLHF